MTEHISELFLRDPETWTPQDLARVVLAYREARAQNLFGRVDPRTGAMKKPRKRKAASAQLDLEDLLIAMAEETPT